MSEYLIHAECVKCTSNYVGPDQFVDDWASAHETGNPGHEVQVRL